MGRSSCNGATDMQQICTAHAQQDIARAVNTARHEGITNVAEVGTYSYNADRRVRAIQVQRVATTTVG